MRRLLRLAATLLIAGGVLLLAWVVLVWRWQDPFTALYTHFQQERLSHDYARQVARFHATEVPVGSDTLAEQRSVATAAAAYRRTLRRGGPVGRLVIGRIGLHMIVVQGTDESSLQNGPGHYIASALPGQGHLIYVAGHRTTYLAPFSDINHIRIGDYIEFEVPYGTFTYRVFRHYVVAADDLKVLVDHGREILRLQACHPRFFATHRYIVDARLVSVQPPNAPAFSPTAFTRLAAGATAPGS